MERDRRLWIVIFAAGVGAILLSACLGALAGGAMGYWAARNVAKSWVPPVAVPQSPETPALPETGPSITEVVDGGPADLAGIQSDDRIVAVDGIRFPSGPRRSGMEYLRDGVPSFTKPPV